MYSTIINHSLTEKVSVHVHLMTGEIFEGVCEYSFNNLILHLDTGVGILGIPIRNIKIIEECTFSPSVHIY
ncbi:hypothetical protein PATY110618_11360 [Paenibacillus typhae]|uniref:Uncharacterized protein n=1 Tax=Paenibacillus typhae TaxID=1174501 RepID=A0A1G9AZQ3_9BACL|nr:hypothetical protein SAMN05216192_13842 [Paenibacillus typhae]